MVGESWFHGLWKPSRKHDHGPDKVRIGVLVFEVASVMSKLVHQWNSLSDKQVTKLREEISSSTGIKKLISEDDDYIVDLICAEMLHNLENMSKVVTRLSKNCKDPVLKSFKRAYDDLIQLGVDQYQWQYSGKKMIKKVKKMETFVTVNSNLYQEMESLSQLEQVLKRIKKNVDHDTITVVDFTKKMAWKQHEVKRLKEISLWNKTYDYAVLILARSVFTIFARIGHVFGATHVLPQKVHESTLLDSGLLQENYPVHNSFTRFSSGPLGNVGAKSGPVSRTSNVKKYFSGPLGNSIMVPSSKTRNMNSFSGPIGKLTSKSGPLARAARTGLKWWHIRDKSSKIHEKKMDTPTRLSIGGPFTGCMMGGNGNGSPSDNPNAASSTAKFQVQETRSSKPNRFDPPPETLGAGALALHYANVIVVLEKLIASPHLIGHDARDDLYNMLPKNVKTALRVRLKPYAKSLEQAVYDPVLSDEWNDAMLGILDWLSPLAHNMIRWQSERSFEHQNMVSRTNVLVQTIYYANQEKIEATITELLVGLNYVWRFSREVNAKALLDCDNGVDDYVNMG
ncbi:protein PSK SIMULATOR 1-like [Bidens hawaiensis]|uniref:protein PSK SIMULATOR 1-like n=1 Tax=Bidens hawaiensis TaxID=980011 RepID=UPI0040499AD0